MQIMFPAYRDLQGSKSLNRNRLIFQGLKRTENQHFAGGNTDWEERKLGKFASSETRLVEIMEYLCKKKHLDDAKQFDSVKEIEFKVRVSVIAVQSRAVPFAGRRARGEH
jgi:hypothetical protein